MTYRTPSFGAIGVNVSQANACVSVSLHGIAIERSLLVEANSPHAPGGINVRMQVVASYVGQLGDGLCLEVGIISAKLQSNVCDFLCDVGLLVLLVLADAPDKVR